MSREEIVNSMSLQDAIQVFRDTNAYGTMDIAKTVILKALEQKPCEYYDAFNKTCRRSEVPKEPCEDAISRQAVIDGLFSIAEVKAKSDAQKLLVGEVIAFMDQLPSVYPKIDIINKIRDEISELIAIDYDFEGYYKAVTDALEIIDKYKSESEVKDDIHR